MLASASQPDPIEPRELHAQLNKAHGYGKLWDVQGQVLSRWHERRHERDLVMKVNTGGGKTVAGLLILQSYVNEGIGPGLYVSPNKQLVGQVLAEAKNLGIAVTTDVDSSSYLSSEAIGVINAHELVNGRTKFSDKRRSRPRAPIGAVVVDDAHAAIATTRTQLALTLPSESSGYKELLALFGDDLKSQSINSYLDIAEDRGGEPMPIPFWAWRDKIDRVVPILRSEAGQGGQLFYSWPGVRDEVVLCRAVFSNRELSITPFCPPIEHVTAFHEAERRLFLTATLSDDSVLVTDFAADPESVKSPITPASAGDIGERMILAPQEINPSLKLSDIRSRIAELSRVRNTVVIVPSQAASEVWFDWADTIAIGDEVDAAVERLRGNDHVGLVVLVNRYDGIDLPDDACRVLVLDGLPEAFSPEEQIRSKRLREGGGVDERQVQRIEQGMGRGVRSNEDHCVVFLLGPRLAQLTVDPRTANQFSPATQAQLKLSRSVAAQIAQVPLERIIGTARQALDRDEGWVKLALQGLRNIAPLPGKVSSASVAERKAFELAQQRDYTNASLAIGGAAENESDESVVGILLERQAAYADLNDPVLGQQILARARYKNRNVIRPQVGVSYVPLEANSRQANTSATRLGARFSQPTTLCLEFESLIDDLAFDPNRTEQFEEALRHAGDLIGLGSQRPESDIGSGPDNLWALGGNVFWVIEAKSGASSSAIGKRDLGQLGQSMAWFETRYDRAANPVPVMVHPAVNVYRDATPIDGMRVMTERKLGEFCNALHNFSQAVAAADWTNSEDVERLLRGHRLDASQLREAFTVQQKGVKG